VCVLDLPGKGSHTQGKLWDVARLRGESGVGFISVREGLRKSVLVGAVTGSFRPREYAFFRTVRVTRTLRGMSARGEGGVLQ